MCGKVQKEGISCNVIYKKCKRKNNIRYSNVVPHRSTNLTRCCLTSMSRRVSVLSALYGRSCWKGIFGVYKLYNIFQYSYSTRLFSHLLSLLPHLISSHLNTIKLITHLTSNSTHYYRNSVSIIHDAHHTVVSSRAQHFLLLLLFISSSSLSITCCLKHDVHASMQQHSNVSLAV